MIWLASLPLDKDGRSMVRCLTGAEQVAREVARRKRQGQRMPGDAIGTTIAG
jgi:hypothetical protein